MTLNAIIAKLPEPPTTIDEVLELHELWTAFSNHLNKFGAEAEGLVKQCLDVSELYAKAIDELLG